jgi:hypothetical protein
VEILDLDLEGEKKSYIIYSLILAMFILKYFVVLGLCNTKMKAFMLCTTLPWQIRKSRDIYLKVFPKPSLYRLEIFTIN